MGLLYQSVVQAQSIPPELQEVFDQVEAIDREIREAERRNRIPLTNENKIRPASDLFRHHSPIQTLLRVRRVDAFRWTDQRSHAPDREGNWRAALEDSLWAFHADGTFSAALCHKDLPGESFDIMRGRFEVHGDTVRIHMSDRSDIGATSSHREIVGSIRFGSDRAIGELRWSASDTGAWSVKYSQGSYNYQSSLETRIEMVSAR